MPTTNGKEFDMHNEAIEYIDYMMPIWRSNARRYRLTKAQTESYIASMVDDAYKRYGK